MTTENVNVGHYAETTKRSFDRANQCSCGFSAHPQRGPRIYIGLHAETPTGTNKGWTGVVAPIRFVLCFFAGIGVCGPNKTQL